MKTNQLWDLCILSWSYHIFPITFPKGMIRLHCSVIKCSALNYWLQNLLKLPLLWYNVMSTSSFVISSPLTSNDLNYKFLVLNAMHLYVYLVTFFPSWHYALYKCMHFTPHYLQWPLSSISNHRFVALIMRSVTSNLAFSKVSCT